MCSKLSLHLQSCPEWVPEFVRRSGVEWLKWIDPPEEIPLFDAMMAADGKELEELTASLDVINLATEGAVKVIGRFFRPDNETNDMIWAGYVGASEFWGWLRPMVLARPWLHCIEGPNEPQPMSDPLFRVRLNEFTVELARLMHAEGKRLVGMNWSVGWPDIGTAAQMGPGVQACDYLGLHEYSAPTMQQEQGFLCLRYRRTVAELEAAGFTVPPILVTECGIDGGVIGQPKTGWRTFCDQFLCYLDQLKWYSAEIDRDNVSAATIFTICDWDWLDFSFGEGEAMQLADFIASDEQAPQPERARGIDVSEYQGAINWGDVADSGIEFAICRASVAASVDPTWEQNYQGAKAAGLKVGAYHYLHPTATGQAGVFAGAVAGKDLELGCWADIEDAELTAAKCEMFLYPADDKIGSVVHIYTRASFFDRYGTPDWAEGRDLWVADWRDVSEPALPLAWNEWKVWQKTSDDAVPGIVGHVDLDLYNGTFEKEVEPVGEIKVFDKDGNAKDWAWVLAEFGPLDLRLAEPSPQSDGTMQKVALVEVREQFGPANLNVQLLDINGQPVVGINTAWWYSTAPLLPTNIAPPTSVWEPRADYSPTNSEGISGWAMSVDGYYYWPDQDQAGPYGSWVLAPGHPSDGIFGLGMIAGTDHQHLNLVFQVVAVEDDDGGDDDDETGTDLSAVVEAIDRLTGEVIRAVDALEKIAGVFA